MVVLILLLPLVIPGRGRSVRTLKHINSNWRVFTYDSNLESLNAARAVHHWRDRGDRQSSLNTQRKRPFAFHATCVIKWFHGATDISPILQYIIMSLSLTSVLCHCLRWDTSCNTMPAKLGEGQLRLPRVTTGLGTNKDWGTWHTTQTARFITLTRVLYCSRSRSNGLAQVSLNSPLGRVGATKFWI